MTPHPIRKRTYTELQVFTSQSLHVYNNYSYIQCQRILVWPNFWTGPIFSGQSSLGVTIFSGAACEGGVRQQFFKKKKTEQYHKLLIVLGGDLLQPRSYSTVRLTSINAVVG